MSRPSWSGPDISKWPVDPPAPPRPPTPPRNAYERREMEDEEWLKANPAPPKKDGFYRVAVFGKSGRHWEYISL